MHVSCSTIPRDSLLNPHALSSKCNGLEQFWASWHSGLGGGRATNKITTHQGALKKGSRERKSMDRKCIANG